MNKSDHYFKGMELFGDDDLAGAIEEFKKALELDPDYVDALHALTMSYYHQKDYVRAVEVGKRFLEADPENALAYTSLSMAYQAQE